MEAPATESAGALTPEEQKAAAKTRRPRGRREGRARGGRAGGRDGSRRAAGRSGAGDGGGRRARGRGERQGEAEATRPTGAPQEEGRGERELMGQKVHPGGLRVGVIHDWKSNWFAGTKDFAGYLLEDIKIREHIYKKLSHAGLSDILIRKDKQRITVDIFTARPGNRHRQVGRRGRRAAQGAARAHPQERPHQHQRDQAARAGREARRAVDRRAAREPRQLPPRDEALARFGDPLGRAGDQDRLRRPARPARR